MTVLDNKPVKQMCDFIYLGNFISVKGERYLERIDNFLKKS